MSINKTIDLYSKQVIQEEIVFRDLFGLEELKETRKEYHARYSLKMTWLEFLKREKERKLIGDDY